MAAEVEPFHQYPEFFDLLLIAAEVQISQITSDRKVQRAPNSLMWKNVSMDI